METSPLPSPRTDPLLIPLLRARTHDLHARIESRLDIPARFVSLDSYRRLLERFHGFYAPLEEQLAAPERANDWAALGMDFMPRRKTALLESDLLALGLTEVAMRDPGVCPPDLLPPTRSAANLVGCAYVLEGSTLGGQVIGRYLERTLGLRAGDPGSRFFAGYGSETGAMWQQFRGAVETWMRPHQVGTVSGDSIVHAAVAAARGTFAGLEAWLFLEEDKFPIK